MRFVSLDVDSFKAVKKARIMFGAGLNIVYGPNDLGKSTLASAIQAALLVLPNSAEAQSYSPWYADATPRVTLVFTDDDDHYWKVTKAFGTKQTAELSTSKDGRTFSLDSTGRGVDGKLRGLLGWGIPAPGGKGAPRGLPLSFLSQVLLAPQTDVDGILEKSLADDATNSGLLRLNKALATLAQDPLFKRVFDLAQAEVDKLFTPTGRIKKASELAAASEVIKEIQAELAQVERDLQSSQAVEAEVNRLRQEHASALQRLAEAEAVRESVRQRLEALAVRGRAQATVDAAQAEVNKVLACVHHVEHLAIDVAKLDLAAKAREQERIRADRNETAIERDLREAEDQLRLAQSEDAARQRALQKAKLEARASDLRAHLQEARAWQEKAEGAIAAERQARNAEAVAKSSTEEMEKNRKSLLAAEGSIPAAEQEVALARGIQAYGRWRLAAMRAADAATASQLAKAKRNEAAAEDQEATALADALRDRRSKLAAVRGSLPAEPDLRKLLELERNLAFAEAKLGGGFSIAVNNRGQSGIEAVVDGRPPNDVGQNVVLDALRSVKLAIGRTVDIEVIAGSPEARKLVDDLRAKWRAVGVPALQRAQVEQVAELSRRVAELSAETHALEVKELEVERFRGDVRSLEEQARNLEQQGNATVASDELARMRSLFGAQEEEMLAAAFAKLGKGWEGHAETLLATAARNLQAAQSDVASAGQELKLAEYKAAEAAKAADAARSQADSLITALASDGDPEPLAREAQARIAQLANEQRETTKALQALEVSSSEAVSRAQAAVAERTAAHDAAAQEAVTAGEAFDRAKAAFHSRVGELAMAQSQLGQMNRSVHESVLTEAKEHLAALPVVMATSAEDLSAAENAVAAAAQAVQHASQQLHTTEGALSQVGGAALADEATRLRESLDAARARERELQIDAEAWQLLRETLRAVENEEGAHLGRALANPVGRKFIELTGGRYEGLRLDTALKTEGLSISRADSGDADVIKALSVGTRDQLATLVRLTIAEQLKTAIVLDDQLVHTDGPRLKWFVDAFLKTALESQVVVLTCQPERYLREADLTSKDAATWDVAAGRVRVVDASRVLERF